MNFIKCTELVGCMKEEEAIGFVVMFAEQKSASFRFR